MLINKLEGLPCSSFGKESACNAGDLGLIPALGRSPGEGNGNPLQYSCLENPMDIGAWWATVHGVSKSQTQLNNRAYKETVQFSSVTQSCPTLLTPRIPLFMGFPKQEYQNGLPFPSPGDLPDPGVKHAPPA